MLRKIGGALAGLVIVFLFVQVAELGVHRLHPPAAGTNMNDFQEVKKYVAALPVTALVLVLAGWLFGTVLGTLTAARIGRSAVPAYFIAVLLLIGGIVSSIVIPQPVWFSVVLFAIYVGGSLLGTRLGPSTRTA
jgi:hypothetical protein